jgi:hypothetical protein
MTKEILSLDAYMEGWNILKLFRRELRPEMEEYRQNRDELLNRIHKENWESLYSYFQPISVMEFSSLDELNDFLVKNGYPKYFRSYAEIRLPLITIKQEYKILKTSKYPVLLAHGVLERYCDNHVVAPIKSLIFCYLPYFPH